MIFIFSSVGCKRYKAVAPGTCSRIDLRSRCNVTPNFLSSPSVNNGAN